MQRHAGHMLGCDRSFLRNAKGARILVYHGICRTDPLRYNTLFITQRKFEEQLRYFRKYFNIISLDQFYRGEFSSDRFSICLTFDDGFANNFTNALPLLEKYKVPATFFVTGAREAGYDILWNDVLSMAAKHGPSDFSFLDDYFIRGREKKYWSVSAGRSLQDILREKDFRPKAELLSLLGDFRHDADQEYWLLLEDVQLRALAQSKWATVGAHGYYHDDLARIEQVGLKKDLRRSKQYLERVTEKEITALAFPYGSYSPAVIAEAREAGYTRFLATDLMHPSDEEVEGLRERLTINPFISSLNQSYASITGNYN
ncbi:MAG TPA: polysaccharide deacetylase family protein [Chitinophagaceae bacterium]|nr:polysaccharide deacetylase family protein [Chitinophagaceae bacterium]